MDIQFQFKAELPVDAVLAEVRQHLHGNSCVVLEAPPGAGKTTRVPPALLEFGAVVVLEPRRIAARMAARRVAAEMGQRVGELVGYQVRFDEVSGPQTRLRFLTEGVLTRRLVSDPSLRGVNVVVLDEFHERHLDGDVALAVLRRLQRRRTDLRLVVMSATLDGDAVARYLGGCPVVRSTGRLHPITVEYTPHSAAPLEEQVRGALEKLLARGLDGDVLAFLPGAAEIRRCQRACEGIADRAGLVLLPLHGDLPPEEQDRAVLPGERRKVILSTNVAESSLTIDGVTAVIDSGLARIARDSPWTGLPSLEVTRISKSSAGQRAGRAGRTRPGRVIRLYPQEDFVRRIERETPEITRRELSGLCLDLHAMGITDTAALEWLDAPPVAALAAAEELLRRLGALDTACGLTPAGRAMVRLPLHPRLSALVGEAERRGAGEEGCALAATLSDGRRADPNDRLGQQIRRMVRPRTSGNDDGLLEAVLRAFPDRVAKRRSAGEVLLAGGGSAALADPTLRADFLVAVEIEQRRERGLPLVRYASPIRAEWLLDLFPERITERAGVEWNREAERVEAVSALLFENLVIEESRSGSVDPEQAARLLAAKALDAGIGRFADPEEVEALLARIEFASAHGPVPVQGEAQLPEALESLCAGLRSFAELKSAAAEGGLARAVLHRLSGRERRLLEELAPERLRLQRGRSTQVHYERGKPPWVASRLQDFFGMRETPRVGGGQVAVVVHLLAPSQRPVQTTSDLAGFWQRLYPQVRRELCRRYPKHAWPEDPLG